MIEPIIVRRVYGTPIDSPPIAALLRVYTAAAAVVRARAVVSRARLSLAGRTGVGDALAAFDAACLAHEHAHNEQAHARHALDEAVRVSLGITPQEMVG